MGRLGTHFPELEELEVGKAGDMMRLVSERRVGYARAAMPHKRPHAL